MSSIVPVACLLFIVATVFQASSFIAAHSNITTRSVNVKTK